MAVLEIISPGNIPIRSTVVVGFPLECHREVRTKAVPDNAKASTPSSEGHNKVCRGSVQHAVQHGKQEDAHGNLIYRIQSFAESQQASKLVERHCIIW